MAASTDYNRSENARREFTVIANVSAANGRSYYRLRCPFCRSEFKAYKWSINGGGKRCENAACGAMHTRWGFAVPVVGREAPD